MTTLLSAATHRTNNRTVLSAYTFHPTIPESACAAELFKLHQSLSAPADR